MRMIFSKQKWKYIKIKKRNKKTGVKYMNQYIHVNKP